MSPLNSLLSGAIMMAALIIALVFLRYWRNTRDRFFLYFAVAFALEALQRLLAVVLPPENPDAPLYYLIRLVSYGLILLAVLSKNARR
jgi:hypothetical protein